MNQDQSTQLENNNPHPQESMTTFIYNFEKQEQDLLDDLIKVDINSNRYELERMLSENQKMVKKQKKVLYQLHKEVKDITVEHSLEESIEKTFEVLSLMTKNVNDCEKFDLRNTNKINVLENKLQRLKYKSKEISQMSYDSEINNLTESINQLYLSKFEYEKIKNTELSNKEKLKDLYEVVFIYKETHDSYNHGKTRINIMKSMLNQDGNSQQPILKNYKHNEGLISKKEDELIERMKKLFVDVTPIKQKGTFYLN